METNVLELLVQSTISRRSLLKGGALTTAAFIANTMRTHTVDAASLSDICNTTFCPITLSELSKYRPAIHAYGRDVWLGWTDTDGQLNTLQYDWQRYIFSNKWTGEKSDRGPALAGYQNTIWIAWTGTDKHLNFRASNGFKKTLDERSDAAPALCVYKGWLWIAWKGTDDQVNIGCFNGAEFHRMWTGERTPFGPALAILGEDLWLSWTGTDNQLNLQPFFSHSEWKGIPIILPRAIDFKRGYIKWTSELSDNGPALTASSNLLYLGWTGTDEQLNMIHFNGFDPIYKWVGQKSDVAPALTLWGTPTIAWIGTDQRLNYAQFS